MACVSKIYIGFQVEISYMCVCKLILCFHGGWHSRCMERCLLVTPNTVEEMC